MIVYGSYVMKFWYPERSSPNDIDVIQLDSDDYDQNLISALKKENLPIEIYKGSFFYPLEDATQNSFLLPEGQLTVHMSHAMYDLHWEKSIQNIIFLQRKNVTYDIESVKILRKGWEKIHAGVREKMNMNLPPEVFFNSNISRYYNHDDLHDMLKTDKIPAFEKILRDNVSVAVSKNKFNNLTLEEKLATVIEEVCVLACERHFDQPVDIAYQTALRGFITRMTSGWYNLFVLDHIDYLWHYQDRVMFGKMHTIMENLRKEFNP